MLYTKSNILYPLLLFLTTSLAISLVTPAEGNYLELTTGTPPPLNGTNAMMVNAGAGGNAAGLPADTPGFSISGNFGDLARVANGAPSQLYVGLRVRGDQHYALTVSQVSITISNLQFHGHSLQGSSDRGSFLRLNAGSIAATGTAANPGGSMINGVLMGDGLPLSEISQGIVTANSTEIMSGTAPSLSGTGMAINNAVEVPILITAPTGLALGPITAGTTGSFTSLLQFGIFPQP
jgi:hypothetical protein